jgi:hypothetical protein
MGLGIGESEKADKTVEYVGEKVGCEVLAFPGLRSETRRHRCGGASFIGEWRQSMNPTLRKRAEADPSTHLRPKLKYVWGPVRSG